MDELNETDRKRIKSAFQYGTENFTEEDLENLKRKAFVAREKSRFLGDQIKTFNVLWSLLQDYWSGEYRAVPWRFVAAVGFAVTYLITPIDILPDFIPLVGFIDDTAVFALLVSAFQFDIDDYQEWKKEREKK